MADLSRKDVRNAHTRIFDKTVSSDEFTGIYLQGAFEVPALILSIDHLPSGAALNILKNTVDFTPSDEKEYFVYFYDRSTTKGYKIGKVFRSIDQIYLLNELLGRYKLEMILNEASGQKKVTPLDFITTMKL